MVRTALSIEIQGILLFHTIQRRKKREKGMIQKVAKKASYAGPFVPRLRMNLQKALKHRRWHARQTRGAVAQGAAVLFSLITKGVALSLDVCFFPSERTTFCFPMMSDPNRPSSNLRATVVTIPMSHVHRLDAGSNRCPQATWGSTWTFPGV